MTYKARAFWSLGNGRGAIREEILRAPSDDEVRVRMLTSGISRGTETLVFRGQVPASEAQRMRCPHQSGDFPGPVKYGYCAVGRIEAGPDHLIDKRIFCLHPHQDYFVVPIKDLHIIPSSLPTERCVLAANIETAINALWDLGPRLGDRIAIVGAGVVGCLTAWLAAHMAGTQVHLIDPLQQRQSIADIFGCHFATPEQAGAEFDCVIHASGHAEGLSLALRLAGFEAQVLELSWYGTQSVTLSLGEDFHARRLNVRSSQVGTIAQAQRSRWSHQRRMELVMTLLADQRLDALLDQTSQFEDLPHTMSALATSSSAGLCHRVIYEHQ